ncbi:hypothetical protein MMC13_002566 [Lambiella insularis]|nr:hypothetical protein [Lambiella insularis]
MLLPTIFTTTALALTANAFLVPLEVADKAKAAASAVANTIIPSSQTINLDCSTCPLAEAGAEDGLVHTWATSSPKTNLVMEFGTTADKQQVTLNGAAFYPPSVSTMLHPLTVKQVLQAGEVVASDVKTYNGELGLSYSLEEQEHVVQEGASLVPVTLTILGLDGKMVNVDAVTIPIIKSDNGDVFLAEVKTTPVPLTPGAESCTTVMCRIKAIIVAKMQAARLAALKAFAAAKTGCMRKLGFKPDATNRGPKTHGGPNKFKHPGHMGNHGRPHGHHHKHGFSGMMHAVKRVFKHVLLPILIGIAAGMAASAVGMVIGHLIVMIWMRYRRRTSAVYTVVEQVEAEEGRPSEDGLPKYEDVESEMVIDEKKELLA